VTEEKIRDPAALSRGKKTAIVFAVMMLYAGFASSGYGVNVIFPLKMELMDAMEYYPLRSATGTLGMMVALPLVGKLCDVFGTKAVVIFGVILQAVFRFLLIHSDTWQTLILFHMVSMVGVGFYVSAPFAILSDVFAPKDRPKYFGMLIAFKAIGSLTGPLVTGVLMDKGALGPAFMSYIPFTVIAMPFIFAFYPNIKTNRMQGRKFDFCGLALVVVGVSCVILFLTLCGQLFGWLSPQGLTLLIVGATSLLLLVRLENRHENPTVAIHLFRKKRFRSAFLCAMCMSAFGGTFGAYIYVYAQQIMHVSATLSSTATMPMTIAQVFFGFIFGRYFAKHFISRFRPAALFSVAVTVVAMGALCFLTPSSSMFLIYLGSILGGVGSVMPQSVFANFFQTELKPEEIGAAQALFTFGGTAGSSLFLAVTGTMFNAGLSYTHVFILAVAFCVAGLVIATAGLKFPEGMVSADKAIR
jgi:MFS family permease